MPSFTEFLHRNNPVRWEDAKEVSRTWREYILNVEQQGLSGYTEESINLDSSHIDHFRKQNSFGDLNDDVILEALAAEGFKSVVEQLLNERKEEGQV